MIHIFPIYFFGNFFYHIEKEEKSFNKNNVQLNQKVESANKKITFPPKSGKSTTESKVWEKFSLAELASVGKCRQPALLVASHPMQCVSDNAHCKPSKYILPIEQIHFVLWTKAVSFNCTHSAIQCRACNAIHTANCSMQGKECSVGGKAKLFYQSRKKAKVDSRASR